jgi:hypothetical protein
MKTEMLKNKVELLQEDIECVHMYLDDKHIPRKDYKGEEYSIIGRIKRLEESFQKQLSELESYYLTFKQQEQLNSYEIHSNSSCVKTKLTFKKQEQ